MGLKTHTISSGLADKSRHEMVKWIQKRNISLLGTFNFHLLFGVPFFFIKIKSYDDFFSQGTNHSMS